MHGALHRLFLAIAIGRDPASADLDHLGRAYLDAMSGATLVKKDERFAWGWRPDERRLDHLLRPVARSAVELLTAGDPRRITICENPNGCGWFFHDGSMNGSQRWCGMEGCGSQVKTRRQYARRCQAAGDTRG